jgi:hypothetical protein
MHTLKMDGRPGFRVRRIVGFLGSVNRLKRDLTCKPDLSEIAISEFKALESRASRGKRQREALAYVAESPAT